MVCTPSSRLGPPQTLAADTLANPASDSGSETAAFVFRLLFRLLVEFSAPHRRSEGLLHASRINLGRGSGLRFMGSEVRHRLLLFIQPGMSHRLFFLGLFLVVDSRVGDWRVLPGLRSVVDFTRLRLRSRSSELAPGLCFVWILPFASKHRKTPFTCRRGLTFETSGDEVSALRQPASNAKTPSSSASSASGRRCP